MDRIEDLPVQLQLTLGESNLILSALAELPYKVSFELIQKIRLQGEQQLAQAREKADPMVAPPPGPSIHQ